MQLMLLSQSNSNTTPTDRNYKDQAQLSQVGENYSIWRIPILGGRLHIKRLPVASGKTWHLSKLRQLPKIVTLLPDDQTLVKHNWNLLRQCGIHRKGYRYVGPSLQEPRPPHDKIISHEPVYYLASCKAPRRNWLTSSRNSPRYHLPW